MIQELTLRNPGLLGTTAGFFDFIRSFFAWWYGDVPINLFSKLRRTLIVINDITSFGIILKGFFRPWKNDFNIAGWLVGLFIKTCYLPIICVLFAITFLIFIVLLFLQLAILPTIVGLILVNPFLRP
jgi:hypothetical protein